MSQSIQNCIILFFKCPFSGYNKYDFWTSGNNLGTDMYLWMSTGLPFNATFNYMRRMSNVTPYQHSDDSMDPVDLPQGSTAPQRTARHGYVTIMIPIINNICTTITIIIRPIKAKILILVNA